MKPSYLCKGCSSWVPIAEEHEHDCEEVRQERREKLRGKEERE